MEQFLASKEEQKEFIETFNQTNANYGCLVMDTENMEEHEKTEKMLVEDELGIVDVYPTKRSIFESVREMHSVFDIEASWGEEKYITIKLNRYHPDYAQDKGRLEEMYGRYEDIFIEEARPPRQRTAK